MDEEMVHIKILYNDVKRLAEDLTRLTMLVGRQQNIINYLMERNEKENG